MLAALNALVVDELLHAPDGAADNAGGGSDADNAAAGGGGGGDWCDPPTPRRRACLLRALTRVLWGAGATADGGSGGGGSTVTLAVPGREEPLARNAARGFAPDGVTERLVLVTFESRAELAALLDAQANRAIVA